MVKNGDVKDKSIKINQALNNCKTELNLIEKRQNDVVRDLRKKTDNRKIAKIKKEIEAL